MEKKRLRNLLWLIVFGVMLFSQPAQLLTQMEISQTNESTISSASYTSNVSAAHITSPTTVPIYHEWKADPTLFPRAKKITNLIPFIPEHFLFTLVITESTGFLDAFKYQSNYLP